MIKIALAVLATGASLVACGTAPAAQHSRATSGHSAAVSVNAEPPTFKAPAGFDPDTDTICFVSSKFDCTDEIDITATSPENCAAASGVYCNINTVRVPAGVTITKDDFKSDAVVQAYQAPFPDRSWKILTLKWPDGSSAKIGIHITSEWSLMTVKSKILAKSGKPLFESPYNGQFTICDTYNTSDECPS
ncbi:hypothetical protein ABTY98_20890 [Streptomyces sp. NPDC096040]|uniref:hypothetical protein n=1 Tax=Streptomyces sp. NPDC096040 TaxID=3155541 RepID=UPI003332BB75